MQTNRTDRQTVRQAGRQAGRQTDRQLTGTQTALSSYNTDRLCICSTDHASALRTVRLKDCDAHVTGDYRRLARLFPTLFSPPPSLPLPSRPLTTTTPPRPLPTTPLTPTPGDPDRPLPWTLAPLDATDRCLESTAGSRHSCQRRRVVGEARSASRSEHRFPAPSSKGRKDVVNQCWEFGSACGSKTGLAAAQ